MNSDSSSRRSEPKTARSSSRITIVAAGANTAVKAMLLSWMMICAPCVTPSGSAHGAMNSPVARAPQAPPTPCTPNTSSESS
jgi:hypothetical protein